MKLLKSIFQKATQATFILTCYYDKNLNQTLTKSEPECYLNDLYVLNQLNYKTSFQYTNTIDKHKLNNSHYTIMQKANVREEVSSTSSEYLTFEDICPTWSNKLKADLDKSDLHILTRKPEMCIVGEAWGYTSRYLGYRVVYLIPFIGCWKCIKFGNKIGKTAKQHGELCKSFLHPTINDFVYHWNEKHQHITLKKNEEKGVVKLNIMI